MEAPQAGEGKNFWKANKEFFVSVLIILVVMVCLKYLFKMALEYHLT